MGMTFLVQLVGPTVSHVMVDSHMNKKVLDNKKSYHQILDLSFFCTEILVHT